MPACIPACLLASLHACLLPCLLIKLLFLFSPILDRTWTMVVVTWDLPSRTARLYINGEYYTQLPNTNSHIYLKTMITNHTYYEIGLKKDSNDKYNGLLKDLMVYYRTLNYTEIQLLYSKYMSTYSTHSCYSPFHFNLVKV